VYVLAILFRKESEIGYCFVIFYAFMYVKRERERDEWYICRGEGSIDFRQERELYFFLQNFTHELDREEGVFERVVVNFKSWPPVGNTLVHLLYEDLFRI